MRDVEVLILSVDQRVLEVLLGALEVLQLLQHVRLIHQVVESLIALHLQDFLPELGFDLAVVSGGRHRMERIEIVSLRDIIDAAVGQNFRFGIQFLVGRNRSLCTERQA